LKALSPFPSRAITFAIMTSVIGKEIPPKLAYFPSKPSTKSLTTPVVITCATEEEFLPPCLSETLMNLWVDFKKVLAFRLSFM